MSILKRLRRQAGESSEVGPSSLWSRSQFSVRQYGLIVVGLLIVAGGVLIFAGTPLDATTDPNSVIVQYSLPHKMMTQSTTDIATPMATPPFTLYGNGLLICGPTEAEQQMADMPGMANAPANLLTAITLSRSQITSLIQQIVDTGFLQLNHEYYKFPVMENQHTVQLNLLGGSYYTMYYGDVPAPTAYTATVTILTNMCAGVTKPYVPSQVTLRVKKDVTPPAGEAPTASTEIDKSVQSTVNSALLSANAASAQSSTTPVTATVPGEVDETVTGKAAQNLVKHLAARTRKFLKQNNNTYEVAVDQPLPKVNNPLNVNYASIRSSDNSLSDRLVPKAYADGSIPVRIVLLLASDGGSTDTLTEAQGVGQSVHDWYCGQVGKCYAYGGVSVVRGSQTMAYYDSCHYSYCGSYDPLTNVLENVSIMDAGTIYQAGVDTELVVGWNTGELSYGACGYGFVGSPLAAVDLHEPTIVNSAAGKFCQPGHDMAHELGHTFGLNHTGNSTLMDGPPYATYAPFCDIADSLEPTCGLDPGQANTLRNSTPQYFGFPVPAPTLGYAKVRNTGSGTVEAHWDVLFGDTASYRRVGDYTSDFSEANSTLGQFQTFGSYNYAPELGFIKLAGTPSGHVEVHWDVFNGSSYVRAGDYVSDFSEADATNGDWQLFGSVNGAPELGFIKARATGSGTVEGFWDILQGGRYVRAANSTSDFSIADGGNGTWMFLPTSSGTPLLGFVKYKNAASGRVEAFLDNWSNSHFYRIGNYTTDFSEADALNGTWQMFGGYNGATELGLVKQFNTGSHQVEVHWDGVNGTTFSRAGDFTSDFSGSSDAYNGSFNLY